MDRRQALALTASLLGTTIIGSNVLLSGCSTEHTPAEFSNDDLLLLNEIGETILPTSTLSPGAKEAQVGLFMQSIVNDCYDEQEKKVFFTGLESIKNNNFLKLKAEDRTTFLSALDKESQEQKDGSQHYYTMLKQLTIWGYFSSEVGSTKALRYNPIPGRFDGCIPYKNGDKAWA